MPRIVLPVILSLCLLNSTRGEEPVHFADVWLKITVEDQLWITDPTPTDMLGLISLSASLRGISNLMGLECATNLEALDVAENNLHDISLLAGLVKLRTLVLNNNQITDLSPLSGLHNLELLDIHENGISDLSTLASLGNLRHLNIHENEISDISALSGASNLETLIANINQIHDISTLGGLLRLSTLNMEDNKISDISALSALSNLRDLNLRNNQIVDLSLLTALTSLQSLYLQGNPWSEKACDVYIPQILANNPGIWIQHECGPFAVSVSSGPGGSVLKPGEGVFIYEYDESLRLEARADPYFLFVGWSGTLWSVQNPEIILVRQNCEIQANFVSTLETIHVDDDSPNDPRPDDFTESDPAENGTMEHPFDQIQKAINVAADGATILVRPGTYCESIDFLGKSIEIAGTSLEDPNELAWPVIQGVRGKPVVSLTNSKDADCLLRGCVLTRGDGRLAGGVCCSDSHLTIANCLIVGNRVIEPTGATIYCTDSNVVLVNCTIADNYAGKQGATLSSVNSHVTLVNSILWANVPREIIKVGAGDVSVNYSAIAGGWPSPGCVNADPLFAGAGYWANPNNLGEVLEPGNPNGVWVLGDYHLRSQAGHWDPQAGNWVQDAVTSPCIDAGDPSSPVGREPSPNGDIINLGAYGGTATASKSDSHVP